jgi:hypothetical protein
MPDTLSAPTPEASVKTEEGLPTLSTERFKEKVYGEAGDWVRLANTITWTIGALVCPISAAALGFGVREPKFRPIMAVVSLFLFSFWVYASYLYRKSAVIARSTLMAIETSSLLPLEMCLYRQQGQVGMQRFSVFNMQKVTLAVLILVWVVLLLRS